MGSPRGETSFLKILIICLFLERGVGKEKEGEKHQCVVACHTPPPGDPAYNTGLCPDWESNPPPIGSQARPALNPLTHTSQTPKGKLQLSPCESLYGRPIPSEPTYLASLCTWLS